MTDHVDDILNLIDAGLQTYEGTAGGYAPDDAMYRGVTDNRDACWRCQENDASDRYDGACAGCALWLDGSDDDPLENRDEGAIMRIGRREIYGSENEVVAGIEIVGNTITNNGATAIYFTINDGPELRVEPGTSAEIPPGSVIARPAPRRTTEWYDAWYGRVADAVRSSPPRPDPPIQIWDDIPRNDRSDLSMHSWITLDRGIYMRDQLFTAGEPRIGDDTIVCNFTPDGRIELDIAPLEIPNNPGRRTWWTRRHR